jgi:Fe2+ transport system protein FeoA
LQERICSPILPAVNKPKQTFAILEGQCAGTHVCPLSKIKAGSVVSIKELSASPELSTRLREMGLGEQQKIKLLSSRSNIICQVCNARLGISRQLAQSILVEALPGQMEAA